MSESPDIWRVPEAPPEIRGVARIALWMMGACACAWAFFAACDVYQLEAIGAEQALALLSLVAWLVWLRPLGGKTDHSNGMSLLWFNDPKHGLKERTRRQTAKPLIQPSHWRTRDGQAVQVQVNLDIGTHLLLRFQQGKVVLYHWVRDTDLAGPWRWRIYSVAPQQANGQLHKQPHLAKRHAHDKDAWHHRSP